MVSLFYKTFEDKFRGSRELIKSRLQIYKPFIEPIKDIYSHAHVLDLGCGRGEWLEYATELGFIAEGVDLDEHMLEEGKKLGLDVHIDNAISFLEKQPDERYAVISAFHFVEHIEFVDLQKLVEQALRVLKPGGLLIMETPNPENIIVGTFGFYTDPTHEKPIPPNLLAFLPEYYGFERTKILRMQESINLISNNHNINLIDVIGGVSQDYAVIAQKKCFLKENQDVLSLQTINKAFEAEYGVTLNQLATRYDQQNSIRQEHLELHIKQLNKRVNDLCRLSISYNFMLICKFLCLNCLKCLHKIKFILKRIF